MSYRTNPTRSRARASRFDDAWHEDALDVERMLPFAEEHGRSRVPELQVFQDEGWITEVLYELKSGKEATAWACAGGPTGAAPFVVAKVYRPLEQRGFRNDAVYQAGRWDAASARERRAVAQKSRAGNAMRFASWVEDEFRTLARVHAAGARVPRPLTKGNDVILMEMVGDADGPAPPLKDVRLTHEEAPRLFDALLRDIERWLACRRVHGDLSAYNILYWQGQLTVIDFPQAVDPDSNPHARELLERDITNVVGYFRRHGVRADPARIAHDLWTRWQYGELRRETSG